MQIGELGFECHDGMAVAGDVAGPSGARTHPHRGLDHRIDDRGVASHPEIIVRAPNNDLAGGAVVAPNGKGWAVGPPLQIDKGAIAVFPTHRGEI